MARLSKESHECMMFGTHQYRASDTQGLCFSWSIDDGR